MKIPEFIKPYWSGPSLPNWMSFSKKDEVPPQAWKWEWWYCKDGHCKILSNRKPVCPVCNTSMYTQVVIDGKTFNLVEDHMLIVQPAIQK